MEEAWEFERQRADPLARRTCAGYGAPVSLSTPLSAPHPPRTPPCSSRALPVETYVLFYGPAEPGWTPTPTSCRTCCDKRRGSPASRSGRSSSCTPTWWCWAMMGSYNRVAAFARDWKAARQQEQKTCGRGVFVPLAFLAGEAFQFDWSEDWAVIAGISGWPETDRCRRP
jgi:hypothetical protein